MHFGAYVVDRVPLCLQMTLEGEISLNDKHGDGTLKGTQYAFAVYLIICSVNQ
jgi:hypothetical protein